MIDPIASAPGFEGYDRSMLDRFFYLSKTTHVAPIRSHSIANLPVDPPADDVDADDPF
jgi:hypothetical protein